MKKWGKELLPYVITIIAVVIVKTYLFTPILVDGKSMYPKLHNNDLMILNKVAYKTGNIKRFDIIVVEVNNKRLIKRVIALPGEKIKVRENKLYIDGKLIEQNFLEDTVTTYDFDLKTMYELDKMPDNKYFVMGDNRLESLDSRSKEVGLIDENQIVGKATFTLFPFSRFGTKRQFVKSGIIICGNNGSGKSTLGKELAKSLNYKLMDIEDYYFPNNDSDYKYDYQLLKTEVVKALLKDMKDNEKFVMTAVTGNYGEKVTSQYTFAVLDKMILLKHGLIH